MLKIALVCLILAVVSFKTSQGACYVSENGTRFCDVYTQWTASEEGAVSWAKNCDFVGHDTAKMDAPVDTMCGKNCLANTKCTHYTWQQGTCFLKRFYWLLFQQHLLLNIYLFWLFSNPRQKAEEPSKKEGATCGYINERTDFVRVGK